MGKARVSVVMLVLWFVVDGALVSVNPTNNPLQQQLQQQQQQVQTAGSFLQLQNPDADSQEAIRTSFVTMMFFRPPLQALWEFLDANMPPSVADQLELKAMMRVAPTPASWITTYDEWVQQVSNILSFSSVALCVLGAAMAVSSLYQLARASWTQHGTSESNILVGGPAINKVFAYLENIRKSSGSSSQSSAEWLERFIEAQPDPSVLEKEVTSMSPWMLLEVQRQMDEMFFQLKSSKPIVSSPDVSALLRTKAEQIANKQKFLHCVKQAKPVASKDDYNMFKVVTTLHNTLLPLTSTQARKLKVFLATLECSTLLEKLETGSDCTEGSSDANAKLTEFLSLLPTHVELLERVHATRMIIKRHVIDYIDSVQATTSELNGMPLPELPSEHSGELAAWSNKVETKLNRDEFHDHEARREFVLSELREFANMFIRWEKELDGDSVVEEATFDNDDDDDDEDLLEDVAHSKNILYSKTKGIGNSKKGPSKPFGRSPVLWSPVLIASMALHFPPKRIQLVFSDARKANDEFMQRAEEFLRAPDSKKLQLFQEIRISDAMDYVTTPATLKPLSTSSRRWKENINWNEVTPGQQLDMSHLNTASHVVQTFVMIRLQFTFFFGGLAIATAVMVNALAKQIAQRVKVPCHMREIDRLYSAMFSYLPSPACPLYGDAVFTNWSPKSLHDENLSDTVSYRCWSGQPPVPSGTRKFETEQLGQSLVLGPMPKCDAPSGITGDRQTRTICVGGVLKLSCPQPQQRIAIFYAKMGRSANSPISCNTKPSKTMPNTCFRNVLPIVASVCALQNKCELRIKSFDISGVGDGTAGAALMAVTASRSVNAECSMDYEEWGGEFMQLQWGCLDDSFIANQQHQPWPWQLTPSNVAAA